MPNSVSAGICLRERAFRFTEHIKARFYCMMTVYAIERGGEPWHRDQPSLQAVRIVVGSPNI